MRSIDGLLGHHDLVEREEGLIKAGCVLLARRVKEGRRESDCARLFRPKPDDLKPYLAAIDRLVSASEALRKTDAEGQRGTLAQMVRLPLGPCLGGSDARAAQSALIDSGAKQLVAVFTRWVKETSPSMDAGKLFDQGALLLPLHLLPR